MQDSTYQCDVQFGDVSSQLSKLAAACTAIYDAYLCGVCTCTAADAFLSMTCHITASPRHGHTMRCHLKPMTGKVRKANSVAKGGLGG